ncbi:DNA (cytosine-5-)-methyltransferase [Vallicoccus soli]|uniref:Cytosine-specific methyltransferase n=1 Tax=Vallicoccus soli TaxID=2339232 RepID=A0A3A3YQN9_9ACTN|nr:DNA (cytosine-5-)-methyltransferase [Vallicoccus soli]RJK92516.1 DNA (cytosine-5-)-methyltransferase [Vallicoccus soli]
MHLPSPDLDGLPDGLAPLAPLGEALADGTRRRVLTILVRDGRAYPSVMARELGVSRTALSHHLNELRSNGLVVSTREGRRQRQELSSLELRRALHDLVSVDGSTAGHGQLQAQDPLTRAESPIGSISPADEPHDPRPVLLVPSRIASTHPHHEPRALTAEQRAAFRQIARLSRSTKAAALAGTGARPLHEVNQPALRPVDLMPETPRRGLQALSLFSGGGGLDLGFHRAGFAHVASFELLQDAAATLQKAHPDWQVFGGAAGDVGEVDWRSWRDQVDVLHGGPPCQPFSVAGRQRGQLDPRDGWPAFVRAVRAVRPLAFVAENVPALTSRKFAAYVEQVITGPLSRDYTITRMLLRSEDFGVPQTRRRVVWVGFRRRRQAARYTPPSPTHAWTPPGEPPSGLPRTMGVREALGLPDIGFDCLSPTIRSTLTGPRHTTSILNSTAAQRVFERLQVWPNGVAPDRERARAFVAANGHFRLAVPDVALLQGFPEDWPFQGATYMQLGQIGNAVPPPMAYAVAQSMAAALT